MKNMELYDSFRNVPDEAKKQIAGGRLKGFTDINPMWRIKVLTDKFGPCGTGWWYTVDKKWLENSMALDDITANVDITLYYIDPETGKESHGIPGAGGSKFVAKEKDGLYCDDECYKKALTDALSVACKALGIGADVYWEKDSTKYTTPNAEPQDTSKDKISKARLNGIVDYCDKHHIPVPDGADNWTNAQADEFRLKLKGGKK